MSFFEQLTDSRKLGTVVKSTSTTVVGVRLRGCNVYIHPGDLVVFLHTPGNYIIGRYEQETNFKMKKSMIVHTETAGGPYNGVNVKSYRKKVNVDVPAFKFKQLGTFSYGKFNKMKITPVVNADIYVCNAEMRKLIETSTV